MKPIGVKHSREFSLTPAEKSKTNVRYQSRDMKRNMTPSQSVKYLHNKNNDYNANLMTPASKAFPSDSRVDMMASTMPTSMGRNLFHRTATSSQLNVMKQISANV